MDEQIAQAVRDASIAFNVALMEASRHGLTVEIFLPATAKYVHKGLTVEIFLPATAKYVHKGKSTFEAPVLSTRITKEV